MQLAEYLKNFLNGLSNTERSFTSRLEQEAIAIKDIILRQQDNPSVDELERVKKFLIEVEMWKADCMEEKTGNAIRNSEKEIWDALRGAISASTDLESILSIMNLIGFGNYKDDLTGQRRAKRATAVLRFLKPDEWGVVDWRTVAILSYYGKHGFNMEAALEEARKSKRNYTASLFDLIDEKMAIDIVYKYRGMRNERLPRTVDVELALYGASFLAWPRTN